jgi:hypothetical protein
MNEPLTLLRRMLARATVLFVVLASGPVRAEERFAVLIGANIGWANDRPLRYAEADAERMKDVLVELGGVAPDRVWLLRDPHTATVRAHLERLAATLRMMGEDSLVVFYYSGHADEQHLHLRGPPLSYRELREGLESLPATVRIGVLDACRSGSIVAPKGGTFQAPFQVEVVDELKVRGLALLTSSGADELSQEARALAGSVFTHHLISGLRGAGDVDGDGAVGLSEAWRYALQHTEVDTATMLVPHRPAFRFELEGQGELLLTRQTQARSRLVLPQGAGERYVVVDEHEARLVAEARVRPGAFTILALAPGRYAVKRVRAERLDVAELLLEPEQERQASALSFTHRPLAEGLLKGRPDAQDEVGLREWRRGEALRLLAVGEAGAALGLFEELLARWPEDPGALRGKARALVRMAEAYDRLGDRQQEQEALRAALAADDSLAQDPDFARWMRRLEELEALKRRAQLARGRAAPKASPLRWGAGLELVGNRGMLVASGRLLIQRKWLAVLSVDAFGPGVGLGLRHFSRIVGWSSFVGGGLHLPFSALGLPSRSDAKLSLPIGGQTSYQTVWGTNVHAELGMHYLSYPGFAFEWNLGLLAFHRKAPGSWRVAPMVGIGVGWYFKRG